MSRRNRPIKSAGFTIVELLLVISLIGIFFVTFGTFFNNYLTLYFGYQKDGSNFTELANQSTRISDVMRGIVDITSEGPSDLNAYAYFAPADAYTSVVHYYLNAAQTAIMVDVTPMTANPPNGVPIIASKKTYTIVTNYYAQTGVNLFTYYDATGAVLNTPIADEHTIVDIGVNLSEPATHNKAGQQLAVTVSLRNRKTNL